MSLNQTSDLKGNVLRNLGESIANRDRSPSIPSECVLWAEGVELATSLLLRCVERLSYSDTKQELIRRDRQWTGGGCLGD